MSPDRTLRRRLATAAILLPLFALTMVVGGWLFLAAVLAITAAASGEFFALAEAKPYRARTIAGLGLALAIPAVLYVAPHTPMALVGLLVAGVVGIGAAQMADARGHEALGSVAFTVFGALYCGLLLGHMVLVREVVREIPGTAYWVGAALLGVPIVLTWVNDTVAYFAGRRWGRRRLLARVSPGKSWEGAIAAFFATAGLGAIAIPWLDHIVGVFEPLDGLALGALVGVAAPVGDLIESAFKRDAGVKDSSGLVPGHGGVLDRFDSMLVTVPVFYHYLRGWVL